MALSIKALANSAGVATDTVRFYERRGLLMPEGRSASGYREYGQRSVRRLRFIRRARAMGFTLDEISELLVFGETEESTTADVLTATERKIAKHREKIAELVRLRDALVELAVSCPGDDAPARDCPILSHFFADGEDVDGADAPQTAPAWSTHTKETIPMDHNMDACASACAECMTACAACLDACLGKEGMEACARLCRDCVEVCQACAVLCAAGSDNCATLCRACAEICEACAEECGKHDHEHCKRCAEACRRCAEECRKMAA